MKASVPRFAVEVVDSTSGEVIRRYRGLTAYSAKIQERKSLRIAVRLGDALFTRIVPEGGQPAA